MIQLGGVLAPACQLKASDPAVQMTRRATRVEVRLDTSRPIVLDERIEVVGPSGGAVVPVQRPGHRPWPWYPTRHGPRTIRRLLRLS